MKDRIHLIQGEITQSETLAEAGDRLKEHLKAIKKENPGIKIGYVSGVVTSYGILKDNLNRLSEITKGVRDYIPFSFSAGDIFSEEIFNKFDKVGAVNKDYLAFWRKVLPEVTDFFMTPGWEKSNGSTMEYELVKNLKIRIFSVDEQGNNPVPIN